MKKEITVALAGNPNAGKTSLFNELTGARAHVGNYPGVTVAKREGNLEHRDRRIRLVDLPGTYSLTAYSLEELVARNVVVDERPHLVVDVVDATNLERNLYLAVQFMEIGVPVVIALNMMDQAEARGLKIDVEKLSGLLGVPVIPTVARQGLGMDKLLDAVVDLADQELPWTPKRLRYGSDMDNAISRIAEQLEGGGYDLTKYAPRWLALKALEGDAEVLRILDTRPETAARIRSLVDTVSKHLRATLDDEPEGVIADHRYGFITSAAKQSVTVVRDVRRTVSDKIDKVALNRLLGPVALLAVLYGIYQFTFWASEIPLVWSETFFGWLGELFTRLIPEGPLQSLLVSGVIDGVGGVLGFVPLIAFMFFAIAILEDSGYMARIAFIMDRILRTFGLHGNSVLSLMVGGGIAGGCAVPGVMAARTLRDPKERLATILVTPVMNCGAKLPVYAVLIGAFFASRQAGLMFLLTLISWSLALLSARLLRSTVLKGRSTPFVMELPPYRWPTFKGLLIHTWERVWEYIKKAATVILGVSILLWAMMTYPGLSDQEKAVFDFQRNQAHQAFFAGPAAEFLPDQANLDAFAEFSREDTEGKREGEGNPSIGPDLAGMAAAVAALQAGESLSADSERYRAAAESYLELSRNLMEIEGAEASAGLRRSAAGRLGLALETVTRPLGFDWRTNIALLGGVAAKEVVVSTLGTAYSLSGVDPEDSSSLARKLAREPGFNPLVAFTMIIFVMVYAPCFVTLVVIGRETNSLRWPFFALVYNTAVAYLLALAVAVAGRALGLGL